MRREVLILLLGLFGSALLGAVDPWFAAVGFVATIAWWWWPKVRARYTTKPSILDYSCRTDDSLVLVGITSRVSGLNRFRAELVGAANVDDVAAIPFSVPWRAWNDAERPLECNEEAELHLAFVHYGHGRQDRIVAIRLLRAGDDLPADVFWKRDEPHLLADFEAIQRPATLKVRVWCGDQRRDLQVRLWMEPTEELRPIPEDARMFPGDQTVHSDLILHASC